MLSMYSINTLEKGKSKLNSPQLIFYKQVVFPSKHSFLRDLKSVFSFNFQCKNILNITYVKYF